MSGSHVSLAGGARGNGVTDMLYSTLQVQCSWCCLTLKLSFRMRTQCNWEGKSSARTGRPVVVCSLDSSLSLPTLLFFPSYCSQG